ncbi:hypothetical protein MASR2M29_09970 [Spirochaetota bacterium]
MPLETQKILWTLMSVLIVLVVASGIALALAFPRQGNYSAPATVAAVAPARAAKPGEYVRSPETQPGPATAQQQESAQLLADQQKADQQKADQQKADQQKADQTKSDRPEALNSGDIIIIYGDKPDSSAISAARQGPSQAAPAQSSTTAKPYTPAPAQPKTAAAASSAAKSAASSDKTAGQAKTVSVDEYWIQAAAFTSRARADDLQRELAQKGLSTIIIVKELDGISWYRVRIGPYKNNSDAKAWLEKIRLVSGCQEAYISRQTVSRSI